MKSADCIVKRSSHCLFVARERRCRLMGYLVALFFLLLTSRSNSFSLSFYDRTLISGRRESRLFPEYNLLPYFRSDACLERRIHRRGTLPLGASLFATKKSKKQQLASGTKGFGAVVATTASDSPNSLVVEIDRSKSTRSFYERTLESLTGSKDGDNLKRTALAYSYNASAAVSEQGDKLRGVVATRDIPKGNELISIPYEIALDLGPEGNDPTIPATAFLKDYCSVLSNSSENHLRKQAYYRMLPTFDSTDSLGCTNFFSEDALQALQSPYIVEETIRRRVQIQQCYDREFKVDQADEIPACFWMDDTTSISLDHLTWAVWIITSRVLTVQAGKAIEDEDGPVSVQYRRLLIPYLDMCNHDRESKHILTGRATSGGILKIVAGTNVAAGAPVEICYGGGMIGNDRFLQDYGFLDSHEDGFKFVAMDLLGMKRRTGCSDSVSLSLKDRQLCLDAMRTTTIDEDEKILFNLMSDESGDRNIQTAIRYRIGVKRALKRLADQ